MTPKKKQKKKKKKDISSLLHFFSFIRYFITSHYAVDLVGSDYDMIINLFKKKSH